jgi:hypothetical protein
MPEVCPAKFRRTGSRRITQAKLKEKLGYNLTWAEGLHLMVSHPPRHNKKLPVIHYTNKLRPKQLAEAKKAAEKAAASTIAIPPPVESLPSQQHSLPALLSDTLSTAVRDDILTTANNNDNAIHVNSLDSDSVQASMTAFDVAKATTAHECADSNSLFKSHLHC